MRGLLFIPRAEEEKKKTKSPRENTLAGEISEKEIRLKQADSKKANLGVRKGGGVYRRLIYERRGG